MNALAFATTPAPIVHPIRTALVVDGNELQHLPMARMLKQFGVADVRSVLDGSTAIAAMRGADWNLIILDLDLQDATGLQVIDILADHAQNARLVIMSSQPSRILQAAAAYADHRGIKVLATLRKPLQIAQVKRLLEGTLEAVQVDADAVPMARVTQSRWSRIELRTALLTQQIRPYFQPQHCAITGEHVGTEVLARWHRPDGTVLGPAEFLPCYEREGLLEAFTDYIMSCAFEVMALEADSSSRSMAINVPATVANSIHWAQSVSDHASAAGVDPGRVVVEITEDGGALCNAALAGAVTQLRLRGFQCAIDDFGSGDSSLDRLLLVPFNELKVSRSILVEAREHAHARSLLASTIAMARQMVSTVVVEGVESQLDLEMVRSLGGQVTQGFLHAKPMPLDAYKRYVALQD